MPKTYAELCIDTRNLLRSKGIASAELESRELVAFAAGIDRNSIHAKRDLYTSDEAIEKLAGCVVRRLKGEPLAYILGEWDFYSLTFKVTPDVLIPRADTETVVDEVKKALWKTGNPRPRLLDLCCGSGCIGIASAFEMAECSILFADLSDAALGVCKENVKRHGMNARSSVMKANALSVPPAFFGKFDVIASNPPYIRRDEMATLDTSVVDYEPKMALDGGLDGLDFYRAITKNWATLLTDHGRMIFEVGYDQSNSVADILKENGFTNIEIVCDLAGVQRAVSAEKDERNG